MERFQTRVVLNLLYTDRDDRHDRTLRGNDTMTPSHFRMSPFFLAVALLLLSNGASSNDIQGASRPQRNTLHVTTIGSGTVTSADGGINCGSDCSESYRRQASVRLTAVPA